MIQTKVVNHESVSSCSIVAGIALTGCRTAISPSCQRGLCAPQQDAHGGAIRRPSGGSWTVAQEAPTPAHGPDAGELDERVYCAANAHHGCAAATCGAAGCDAG